jgi:SpoIID/LytB domain protein
VALEEYLKGVVPWEMNPSAPLEALKAQAICARSETLAKIAARLPRPRRFPGVALPKPRRR